MAAILVKVGEINISGDTMTVNYEAFTSWGPTQNASITGDVAAVTPSQGVTALKNQVAAFAASPSGGEVTITNNRIWVFGGPQ